MLKPVLFPCYISESPKNFKEYFIELLDLNHTDIANDKSIYCVCIKQMASIEKIPQ